MLSFFVMRYREVKGHWPLMKAKASAVTVNPKADDQSSGRQVSREVSKGGEVADEITRVSV